MSGIRRYANLSGQKSVSRIAVPKHMVPKVGEKDVAGMCDRLAADLGWTVERYEQQRATRITEGLPDRRYVKPHSGRLWVELKAPGGKLTRQQYEWLLSEPGATVIEDVQALADLLQFTSTLGGLIGPLERRCHEMVIWFGARGFRGERKPR